MRVRGKFVKTLKRSSVMIPVKNPKNVKIGGSSHFGKNTGSSIRSAGSAPQIRGRQKVKM